MNATSQHNLAVLTGMQLVFAHALERCTYEIENLYMQNYITSSDYKQLVRVYGKVQADQIIANTSKKILRQQDVMEFNRIIAKTKELHALIQHATEIGVKVVETDEVTAFNHLMQDANDMCRIQLLLANCKQDNKTDTEIENYLKRKADPDRQWANKELIDKFRLR